MPCKSTRADVRVRAYRRFLFNLIICLTGCCLAIAATAQDYDICAPDGIALGGYDVVSYYEPDGPIFGIEEYTAEHDGLRYQFASEQNLTRFEADREKYLPRYQGWCAANLSMGRLACPDYTNFKIEDGSLLLFEHNGFTNGQTLWNSDPLEYRLNADQNASKLLGDALSP